MADDFETSGMMGMGVAAALGDQYSREGREFLPMLANLLKHTMPDQVDLIETGFFKKSTKGVVVNLQGNQLKLEDIGHGNLQASFVRVVKGIALKTEPLTVEEWIATVSESIEEQMRVSQQVRSVLAKTLGLP